MQDKKIVTQGGGDNLYKITEYDGWYSASQVDIGFFSDSYKFIGKARSLKDAIELIRAYSGKDIEEIDDY